MKKFIETIFSFVKITVVLLFIWWYIESCIKSYKEKRYGKFILLSIIPAITIYYMQHQLLFGHAPPGFDNPYMDYDDCTCFR